MMIMSILLGAIVSVWSRAQGTSITVQDRTAYLNDMRVAMERMTKDIRQTTRVNTRTASTFDAGTLVNGVKTRVAYTVSGGMLYRSVDGGASVPLLTKLASSTVFTYTVSGGILTHVTILLTVRVNSTSTLDSESSVETRNL
jgi:type II secretory pathway component PulJ